MKCIWGYPHEIGKLINSGFYGQCSIMNNCDLFFCKKKMECLDLLNKRFASFYQIIIFLLVKSIRIYKENYFLKICKNLFLIPICLVH